MTDTNAKTTRSGFVRSARLLAIGACLAAFGTAGSLPVMAGGHDADHSAHTAPAATSGSTGDFEAVNAKMHKDMAIAFTGNADADFVRGMIPHHQGAIDMAEVVLKHGHDPAIRKLAQDIIAAQSAEIAFLYTWLKQHPQ